MKPEFFSTRDFLCNTNIFTKISKCNYLIQDVFNNTILTNTHDKNILKYSPLILKFKNILFATIFLDQKIITQSLLDAEMNNYLSNINETAWLAQSEVLNNDLISIFKNSERFQKEPIDVIEELLMCLKSHLLFSEIYFYSVMDGYRVTPVIGQSKEKQLSKEKISAPHLLFASHFVSTTKEILFINKKNKSQFPTIPLPETVTNLLALPIIHSEKLIGNFILTNRLSDNLSDLDFDIIRRFSRYAGHILEEKVLTEELKQSEQISENLSKYLSHNVAESIKELGVGSIGGEEKEIVVVFLLLQNYYELTQAKAAKDVINILNYLYEKCHKVAETYEGTLDKIITPAMMFVWNHPRTQDRPINLAIECAREIKEIFLSDEISHYFKLRDVAPLSIGVGINYGKAVAGNLGCKEFIDYTVIGDTINTAQRIESSAKKNQIIVHEKAYKKWKDQTRPNDKKIRIKAKGKSELIPAYIIDGESE